MVFSQNQPPNSAHDKHIGIFKDKIRALEALYKLREKGKTRSSDLDLDLDLHLERASIPGKRSATKLLFRLRNLTKSLYFKYLGSA